MSNQESNQRLVALEEKLSYQQRQFEELNQVIVEQQTEIQQLRLEVNALSSAVKGLMQNAGENLPHEKPPHY
jgi:SlyX protein